jgi:membrane-associated phospholipid phosphatase
LAQGPSGRAPSDPRPGRWHRAGGVRPFVHRWADLARAAAGLAVLVACAVLVRDHVLRSTESAVLLFVNGWPDWLYRPMQVVQYTGVIGAVPAAAAVAAVLRRFRLAVALLVATGLKIWLESVVKMAVHRQRPGVLEPDTVLRGNVAHQGLSFVSGHAIVVFAMAALISPYLRGRWKAVPWTVAALACLARLYLGAHFPLDLVGGAGLGLFIGYLLDLVLGVPGPAPARTPASPAPGRVPVVERPK